MKNALIRSTTQRLKTVLAASLLLLISPSHAASEFMGMNTNEAVWFDSSVPFADLFRTAEPFSFNKYSKGKEGFTYDRDGWISNLNGGQAGSYFVRWLPVGALPQGRYTVSYEGSGQLNYLESASLISRNPGQDIIQLVPDQNNEISAALVIVRSDPNNPVRNIKVTLPGGICQGNPFHRVDNANACGGKPFLPFAEHAEQIVFNPDYLNFMRQFRTIRFMGMSGVTRNDREQNWNHRPNLQEATWSGNYGERGVPLEIMVKLANTLNANAWFNIPHLADADYMTQYARYVNQNLRPGLKAYVEYTNEIWNPVFSQAQYAKNEGYRDQLDPDPLIASLKFYGFKSRQLFQIWDQEFRGDRRRLVRVMSGWAGNPATTAHILKAYDVYKQTDLFAIAPYFYAPQEDLMAARHVDDIFRSINQGSHHYTMASTLNLINKHAEILRPYKVGLAAYEGGQHLVHYGTKTKAQHPNPILIQANRDPRMEHAYIQLLNGFKQAGGKLFIAFSSPRMNAHYGFWGVKEHINQPDAQAPKMRAISRF